MKLFSNLFLGLTLATGIMLTGCSSDSGTAPKTGGDEGSTEKQSSVDSSSNMTASTDESAEMTLVSLKLPSMT